MHKMATKNSGGAKGGLGNLMGGSDKAGLMSKMKTAVRKASIVGATSKEVRDVAKRRGSVMHAMKFDLGHLDPNAPLHERNKNASRLMTANMGSALDKGLMMDEMDNNYVMSEDPAWQARQRKMAEVRQHANMAGAGRGGKHRGRRMSQADISSAIKKKEEATKNIRVHAQQTIQELDKAVANLSKNRALCQEKIDRDQAEVTKINEELVRVKEKKDAIQEEYAERVARRDRIAPYIEEMQKRMGIICIETGALRSRHEKKAHHQLKDYAEKTLTASRGYTIGQMSLKQEDLLPRGYRRAKRQAARTRGMKGSSSMQSLASSGSNRSIAWSGDSTMSSIGTPTASSPKAMNVLRDGLLASA
jgi:hypothetical protein